VHDQLAEVLVLGEQHPTLAQGDRGDIGVGRTPIVLGQMHHVVAASAEMLDDAAVEAFVSQQAHPSGDRGLAENHLLVGEVVGGEELRCPYVLKRQARVRVHHLLRAHPIPSWRRMCSTGMRVPRIVGFPTMISGLLMTRSWSVGMSSLLACA
jgi:hypothetical protein